MDNLNISQKIINYISRNRVSTTEVADCLGKTGVLKGVLPINDGIFAVGPIRYVYAHSESNWSVHEQAREIQHGEIVLIDGINIADRAIAGELVVKYMMLYQQATAIVALGNMRDINDIIKNRYGVWCTGRSPVGCFNKKIKETSEVEKIVKSHRAMYENGIAVCDDTGVVVIPKEKITDEFYEKLEFIEQQEDIWFHCIDFKKWDTYETVCLKNYQNEKDQIMDLEKE